MKQDNNLSNRQKEVLTYIKKYIAKNNTSPSIREIAAGINLNSPATVHVHLKNLIEKGYIKRNNNTNKTIELMVPNEFEFQELQIPILSEEDLLNNKKGKKFYTLPTTFIKNKNEVFILKLSKRRPNFLENDYLLIEKTSKIAKNDYIIIKKDNRIIITNDIQKDNLGKIISLYRKF